MIDTAEVRLWDTRVGAVTWRDGLGYFEYARDFRRSGIELAPLTMPLADRVYAFPDHGRDAARACYHGLPGLLADTLPDRFGNALIDAWVVRQGRQPEDFTPVERLCYTGVRGMGGLEFEPSLHGKPKGSETLDVAAMVELASLVLADREAFAARIESDERDSSAVRDILRVGTSAGGARAKAVIAWNPETGEVRSGQVEHERGFEPWILKFDGVAGNRDRELEDPRGYGRIEYAYHRMALDAGIEMNECRLFHENGRSHFMTRRFDRTPKGGKLHMQSLCALAHLDYNLPGAHSYEQAMLVVRRLGLPTSSVEEQFRRMAFNVLARNQDDHTKNIAFLMNKAGDWSLSPAFDLTYAYNPRGDWTSRHQMTLAGKQDGFELADFTQAEKRLSLRRGFAREVLEEVGAAVGRWPEHAAEAGLEEETADRIGRAHRRIAP